MADSEYTWDENKRQKTLNERGLDFADMENFVWDTATTKQDVRDDYPEPRYLSIGIMGGKLVVVV